MLRGQLDYYWRSHVLAGVALAYAAALVFFVTAMLGYADRALALSVRHSTPDSDVLVYSDTAPAVEVAKQIAALPEVEALFVDSHRAVEALSDTDHLPLRLRTLAPPTLRTQTLVAGRFPVASTEIAITQQLAMALHVSTGGEVTVVGPDIAERYSVTGVYARSPIVDQLDSGVEALVTDADPSYVAYLIDSQDQGGIEVRAAATATTDDLRASILKIPGTVVVNASERLEEAYERQEGALQSMTSAGTWLLTTAFLASTAVVFMTMVGAGRRRAREFLKLKALGVSGPRQSWLALRESFVVVAVAYVVGVSVGYASALGTAVLARSMDGARFLPHTVGVPLDAFVLSFVAVVAATAIGGPLGILLTIAQDKAAWQRRLLVAVPALALLTGALLYATIGMPGVLADELSIDALVRTLLALSALTILAFTVGMSIVRWAVRRLHVGSDIPLLPRSRTGVVRSVALFVVLVSTSMLGVLHTVYAALDATDMSLNDLFDLAVVASPDAPSLAPEDFAAIEAWGSAQSTLTLHSVVSTLPESDSFQPGLIYAVDPTQAEQYFGEQLDLEGKLLVPFDTESIPPTAEVSFLDSIGGEHTARLKVEAANIPVAMTGLRTLGTPPPSAVWMRLTDWSLEHISEDYRRLDSYLGTGEGRPKLSLAVSIPERGAINPSRVGALIQTSLIVILAYVALGRVPRYLSEYGYETRNLRALGLPRTSIRRRRIAHVTLSVLVMSAVGMGLGVGAVYLAFSSHGVVGISHVGVPFARLALNLVSIMLACVGLALLRYHADVSKHTNPHQLAVIGHGSHFFSFTETPKPAKVKGVLTGE